MTPNQIFRMGSNQTEILVASSEVYSEHCQTYKIENN